MRKDTRESIHKLLKSFTQKSLQHFDVDKLKRAYPFHRLFFDEIGLVAFKQERSMVTRMGQGLYPELARLIASEKYSDVTLQKLLEGDLNEGIAIKIDQIVGELRAGRRRPDHAKEMSEILDAKSGKTRREIRVIADVYIGDFEDGPLFLELKTPQPNIDICAESKKKIFDFKALLHDQNPEAYLAFYYNPFVTRAAYAHAPTKRVMDMQAEVLMAEEFWDKIGGSGTFSQLLQVIEDVGNEIREEKTK